MFEVKADLGKNVLFIKLEGNMSNDEMVSAAEAVIKETKKLKKNFTVVNDVSKFKPASPEGAKEILRAQKFVSDNGSGKIIRIVEGVLGKMQLNRNSNAAGLNVIEVSSMEEAKKHI